MARKIKVLTDAYQRTHGRSPRGRGLWAFAPVRDDGYQGAMFTISGTYTEASKAARDHVQMTVAIAVRVMP